MTNHPLPYDLIIFDVDGTLRECTVPGQPCPNKPNEWRLLPNVKETFALYDWTKTDLGFVSNQGGIGLGYLEYKDAKDMIVATVREATRDYELLPWIAMCPHKPDAGCQCRKPSPYMINYMVEDCEIEACKALYVGDMASDLACAEAAGVDFIWAHDFFGWKE